MKKADGGRRVLVLDEHAGSGLVISYALALLGHTCRTVRDVAATLAVLPTFKPDVVIYEWKLRDDAGIGLAARIRTAVGQACLRIIVLSTQNEPNGFRDQESIDAYLTKPFRTQDLDALLTARSTTP
jgi:DNA-binding response OmpR family regulator